MMLACAIALALIIMVLAHFMFACVVSVMILARVMVLWCFGVMVLWCYGVMAPITVLAISC